MDGKIDHPIATVNKSIDKRLLLILPLLISVLLVFTQTNKKPINSEAHAIIPSILMDSKLAQQKAGADLSNNQLVVEPRKSSIEDKVVHGHPAKLTSRDVKPSKLPSTIKDQLTNAKNVSNNTYLAAIENNSPSNLNHKTLKNKDLIEKAHKADNKKRVCTQSETFLNQCK